MCSAAPSAPSLPPKPSRRHHDARVVNARIRQHPPEIPLHEDERRGHKNGGDAETRQQLAGKFMAEAFLRQHVETHDAINGAVDERGAQQRGGGHGRFGVGVGLPSVHRRQAGLGAVTEQHQNERQPHGLRIELVRHARQHRPVHAAVRFQPEHVRRAE